MTMIENGSDPRAEGVVPSRRTHVAATRSIGRVASIFCAEFLLSVASLPVLAGTGSLDVTVTSLPDEVSPSVSVPACTATSTTAQGCTKALYSVQISNAGNTNNVSNTWFRATTYVVDSAVPFNVITTLKAPILTFPAVPGTLPVCSTSADGTTIACQIGQVAAGQTPPPFNFTVRSPATTVAGYQILVAWDVPTGQGASGSLSPVSSSPAVGVNQTFTLIGTPPSPTFAKTKSYVEGAASLYTGNTDIATSTNLGTVKAVVPTAPVGNVATLEMNVDPNPCFSDYKNCIKFNLEIPGTFGGATAPDAAFLKFTLRRDVTTLQKSAKAENAYLTYSKDSGVCYGADGQPLPDCANIPVLTCAEVPSPGGSAPAGKPWSAADIVGSGFAGVPELYKRCITSKTEVKKGAEAGDHIVELIASENGRIGW
jgi:hypothetical protein